MLLLALSLLSPVTYANNPRPFLGKNYIPLDAANRLGAAFYFDNYCYNWKCWGTGSYSQTWIECYSISHRCYTQDVYNSGVLAGGEPMCELMGDDFVTKDRLYCPERTNLTETQEAYCRCYDNNRGEAKCGCTPIPSRGAFPLTYVLCPVGIVLLGGLYMLVRTLQERRMARAQRRVPPYPVSDPINPADRFDLRMESSIVIVSGLGDLPDYMEEGAKLPEYDEVEGPPPAYPGEFGGDAYAGEFEVIEAGHEVENEPSDNSTVMENQSVEIPPNYESLTASFQQLTPPESRTVVEVGFTVIENPTIVTPSVGDSKASMALEDSIESNSGILSDVI